MELVADRFAVHDEGGAFDLASGARVTLVVGTAGGVSEQLRWNARCADRHPLRHRVRAPLIDYGLVGECSRFEAWGTGYPDREEDGQHDPSRIAQCGLRIADCGLRMVEPAAVAALAEMFDAASVGRPYVSTLFGPPGSGKRIIVGELARIAPQARAAE